MITLSAFVDHRVEYDGPRGRTADVHFTIVGPGGATAGSVTLTMDFIASKRFLTGRVFPFQLDPTTGVPYPVAAAVAEEAEDVR